MKKRIAAVLSFVLAAAVPVRAVEVASASFAAQPESVRREILGAARLPDAPLDESRVPGSVAVYTREAIRASGARSLAELLSAQAGVNSFDSIGNGFQPTLDLRGFNAQPAPAVAVVVDGVRVNEADLGQVNWQLIPLEDVERVEVHPGPSTLYGKNALGGVVVVTTRRGGKDLEAEAGYGFGSHRRKKGWAQVSDTAGSIDWLLSASKEHDGGWRRHSEAGVSTLFAKLGYRVDKRSDLAVSYTRADDRLQQPGSLTSGEAAQDPTVNVSEVDTVAKLDMFTYNQRQALPWDLSAAVNGYLRQRREATPLNRGRNSLTESLAAMKAQGLTGQLSRDAEVLERRGVTTAGVELSRSEAESSSRGDFGGFPYRSDTRARDESLGLFAEHVQDLVADRVSLSAGVRYDQARVHYDDRVTPGNSGRQSFHRTNPRAGLNFTAGDALSAYVLYSEGFRAPTVNEVSSIGPFSTSILKPVKARNYEVGGKALLGDSASLRVSAYREDVLDDIYPVFDPVNGYGRNINISATRHLGVEWGLKGNWGRTLEAHLEHAYTRATFQSDLTLDKAPWVDSLWQPVTQQVHKGDRLPMVPEHRISAGVGVHPAEGWTASADGLCVGGQHLLGDEANDEAELPAYCTLGLGGVYERGPWRLFVKGSNVLDRKFPVRGILSTNAGVVERFVTPASGVSVFGGVSWRFTTAAEPERILLSSAR
ncbi:MAG: TonB-dependent receptor [Elusimicrobiota bacterium]|jgi:outer membrane receptor protein involved in Fe transport